MAFDPKKLTTKTAEVITAALQSAKTQNESKTRTARTQNMTQTQENNKKNKQQKHSKNI